MIPEEIRLSTTFCAVPAFIRVDPAMSSRPVSMRIGNFADASSAVPGLLATPIVTAPEELARCCAATVNGVVPLAATEITTSCGVRRAASVCVTASSTSSSAPSMLVTKALSPPATMKRTRSLGQANVGVQRRRAAALRAEIETVEKKLKAEEADWDEEGKRLKAALRRARD